MMLLVYKNRHVVAADVDTLPADGTLAVRRVGLAPGVAGKARRGAAPKFEKPVAVKDLTVAEGAEYDEFRTLAAAPGTAETN